MALRIADSFGTYAAANATLAGKWLSGSIGSITTGQSAPIYQYATENNGTAELKSQIWTAHATAIAHFYWQVSGNHANSAFAFMRFRDTVGAVVHTYLQWNSNGSISIHRGNGTQLDVTPASTFSADQWYHFQFKTTVDDTAGVAILKVNNATVLNLTSQDTRNGGNATIDQFTIDGNPSQFGSSKFANIVVYDGSGATENDFGGELKCQVLRPNGNGNSSQFTGSDGNSTDNYLLVDDTTPNDDTDYVATNTTSNKDTYTYDDLDSTTGTIIAIQTLPYARKDDATARTIVPVARSGATEEDGTSINLGVSYKLYPEFRLTKPGGGAWTISDINSAEFGVKLTS